MTHPGPVRRVRRPIRRPRPVTSSARWLRPEPRGPVGHAVDAAASLPTTAAVITMAADALLAAVIEARGWQAASIEGVECSSASHACCSVTTGHIIVMKQPTTMTSPRAHIISVCAAERSTSPEDSPAAPWRRGLMRRRDGAPSAPYVLADHEPRGFHVAPSRFQGPISMKFV
jgi:hypothetical protein